MPWLSEVKVLGSDRLGWVELKYLGWTKGLGVPWFSGVRTLELDQGLMNAWAKQSENIRARPRA